MGNDATSANQASSRADEHTSAALSPAKCLQLRTKCVDQMAKLHTLGEKGGILREEYETLKNTILGAMQNVQKCSVVCSCTNMSKNTSYQQLYP